MDYKDRYDEIQSAIESVEHLDGLSRQDMTDNDVEKVRKAEQVLEFSLWQSPDKSDIMGYRYIRVPYFDRDLGGFML